MHIYLIGFMGAGKTTIGKKLAAKLNRTFIDLDEIIEKESCLAIPVIFEKYGESYFRKLETECLIQVSQTKNKIIATGGGIVLFDKNRIIMIKTGYTIYLSWSPRILYHRIKKSTHRPLLNGINNNELLHYIEKLLDERRPFYEKADYVVYGDEGTTPARTVEMILQNLPRDLIIGN